MISSDNIMSVQEAFSVVRKLYEKVGLAPEVVDLAEALRFEDIPEGERARVSEGWMNSVFRPLALINMCHLDDELVHSAHKVLWSHARSLGMPLNGEGVTGHFPNEMLKAFHDYSLEKIVELCKGNKNHLDNSAKFQIARKISVIEDELCNTFVVVLQYFCGTKVQENYQQAIKKINHKGELLPMVENTLQAYQKAYDAILKANENLDQITRVESETATDNYYRQQWIRSAGPDGLEELARDVDYYAIRTLKKIKRALEAK